MGFAGTMRINLRRHVGCGLMESERDATQAAQAQGHRETLTRHRTGLSGVEKSGSAAFRTRNGMRNKR